MSELDDFFKTPNQPRIVLRGPQTSGICVRNDDGLSQMASRNRERERRRQLGDNLDYVEQYKKEYEQQLQDIAGSRQMSELEQLSSIGTLNIGEGMLSETDLTAAYTNYSYRKPYGVNPLPIDSYREEVLCALNNNCVVIIQGRTGCGKTTQVPQWILDDCYERRVPCNIAVTQPRRIAAISIAKRVAQERGWQLGDVVGYQVGLDNTTTSDTHLNYMTTGVLLQKLVAAKSMSMYTHVILDEIHERGQEMDFLMLVVKKLLIENSKNIKVVLMSATFGDVEKFRNYFDVSNMMLTDPGGVKGTQLIETDGKNIYNNQIFYLDNLKRFTESTLPAVKLEEPGVTPAGNELVLRLLSLFDYIDESEDSYEINESVPSVLVFLPGINEIEELATMLEDPALRNKILKEEMLNEKDPEKRAKLKQKDYKWWVVVLHSTITSAEQAKAFTQPPPGYRKVILATNIAESSITVPDIKYVIDFCLMKVLVADPETHFTSLQTQWASRTNCTQRAGRAGRVRSGRVYRIVPKAFYEKFDEMSAPEMIRCPLERLVLLAKMLDMGKPQAIFALAMDPPKSGNIMTTMLVLKEAGGLLKTVKGEVSYDDGDITYLGRIMARLPVDIRVAKLIVLGHIFGVLEPCIIMGAAMTVKNIFNTPFRERLNAYNSKLTWADGSRSDCIAFYNLYQVWSRQVRTGQITRASEQQWGRRMYAQVRALKELDDMVRELSRRLSRLHIEVVRNSAPAWNPSDLPLILKVLIAGAFYPNYYAQPAGDECREREALKQLDGLDPCTTVYLKDFPSGQPPDLYAAFIKNKFRALIGDEPRVTFDRNSNKIYLSFSNTGEMNQKACKMPGRVALPVYKAVKARQLNLDIVINSLPLDRALALAAEMKRYEPSSLLTLVPQLPAITDTYIRFRISHMIDPGHFWIHNDQHLSELAILNKELHDDENRHKKLYLSDTVKVGSVCLAPFDDNSGLSYYRAVVRQLMPESMVWVFYLDYGNYGRVSSSNLRELPHGLCQQLPPLALECVLSHVGPSLYMGDTIWSKEAHVYFAKLTMGKELLGKVYSVAQGVVSLELMYNEGTVSMNEDLVRRGLARRVEESYDSKLNHDIRETAQDLSLLQQNSLSAQQAEQAARPLHDPQAPDASLFTGTIRLKGPFSPLETTLRNPMLSGKGKTVTIEWNSVNSVLLDTEPQEPYQRMVVAAQVGQNRDASKLTLRHTTVMPNIPGLPALMALLFAPSAELRCDDANSRYAAALCGLGAHLVDGQLEPFFDEHDLHIDFDVDITNKDLKMINHLRYLMNTVMYCPPGEDSPAVQTELLQKVPSLARTDIMTLVTRCRKHREFVSLPHSWRWTGPSPEQSNAEDECLIYPFHNALPLTGLDSQLAQKRLAEDKKLQELVTRNFITHTRLELNCPLCGVGPFDLQSLRIHLHSRKHLDKISELKAILHIENE